MCEVRSTGFKTLSPHLHETLLLSRQCAHPTISLSSAAPSSRSLVLVSELDIDWFLVAAWPDQAGRVEWW
jgi:hypothetical protein